MRPDDPCIEYVPYHYVGTDDDISAIVWPYDSERIHRAACQRQTADEMGVSFAEVSAVIQYMRPLTRQEAWDDYGQEQYNDWEGGPVDVPDDWMPRGEGSYHWCYVRYPDDPHPTRVQRMLYCEYIG